MSSRAKRHVHAKLVALVDESDEEMFLMIRKLVGWVNKMCSFLCQIHVNLLDSQSLNKSIIQRDKRINEPQLFLNAD